MSKEKTHKINKERLKNAIKDSKYTQKEIAELLGYNAEYLSRAINKQALTLEMIDTITRILDIDPNYINMDSRYYLSDDEVNKQSRILNNNFDISAGRDIPSRYLAEIFHYFFITLKYFNVAGVENAREYRDRQYRMCDFLVANGVNPARLDDLLDKHGREIYMCLYQGLMDFIKNSDDDINEYFTQTSLDSQTMYNASMEILKQLPLE